jgi:hypothetical protein
VSRPRLSTRDSSPPAIPPERRRFCAPERRRFCAPERRQFCAPERRRPAIALLAVLALQVVAAILLAGVATCAFDLSREARLRERTVREFWSCASLESVLLPRAADVFERRDLAQKRSGVPFQPAGPVVEQIVVLNELPWRVRLGDENAKLCFTTLANRCGRACLQRALHTQVAARSSVPLRHGELGQFLARAASVGPEELAWGDLFRVEACGDEQISQLVQLSRQLTLWSGGTVNPTRADPDTVKVVLEGILGPSEARRLWDRYDPSLPGGIVMAAHAMKLRGAQLELLRGTFVPRSEVYSIEVGDLRQVRPRWFGVWIPEETPTAEGYVAHRLW